MVKVYPSLREKMAGGCWELEAELAPGATVSDVISSLGLSPEWVWPVQRNETAIQKHAALEDGDQITMFPTIGGGSPDSHNIQAGN